MTHARRSLAGLAVPLALWLLAEPRAAHAYLDPSTGSMLISAVVAFFATLGMAIRTYWYRVAAFFRGGSDGGAKPPERPADAGR